MSQECETILVEGWDGLESVTINKADFDESKHKEFKPKSATRKAAPKKTSVAK